MQNAVGKREKTKEAICQALICLCADRQFKTITVNEICAKAGIHRSTFYRYYETLDIMLGELGEDYFSRLEKAMQRLILDRGPTASRKESFWELAKFYTENAELTRFVLFSGNYKPAEQRLFELVKRHYIIIFESSGLWVEAKRRDILIDYQVGGIINCLRNLVMGQYPDIKEVSETLYEIGLTNLQNTYMRRKTRGRQEMHD